MPLRTAPSLLALVLSVPLAAAVAPAGAASPDDFPAPGAALPLESVAPGTIGTARTVLAGTAISEFDVEIVSVVRGVGPGQDMILGRAQGETIERLGVAQGMSGSPVYVDGRLIGAVSSTWSFASEPYLGITPVHQMAREAADGFARESSRAAADGVSSGVSASATRTVRWPGLDPAPPLLPPPPATAMAALAGAGFAPIGSPLVLGGFDPRLVDLARDVFAPWGLTVTTGGGGEAGGGALEPGATLGVRLAGGDANMTAIGTVTWIDGDRVYGFGHPLFLLGDVEMPIVNGTIHAVIPSRQISFKLGSGGDIVGTLVGDRRSGVFGRIGPAPHLTRFDLDVVRGDGPRESYGFDLVRHPDLGPALVGLVAGNALLAGGGMSGEATVGFRQRVVLDDGRETTVRTVLTGDRPLGETVQALSDVTEAILGNPFERVAIDRVEAELTIEPGMRATMLTELSLAADEPHPGDKLRGTYTLRDWRGSESRHAFSIPLPADAREGRYLLLVGDAQTARRFESERDPRAFAPRTLDEYLDRLGRLRQPDEVYVHLYRSSPGVRIDDRPLADLPPSALAVMRGPARSGVQDDLPAEIVSETRIPVGRFVQGAHTILFEVRKEKP